MKLKRKRLEKSTRRSIIPIVAFVLFLVFMVAQTIFQNDALYEDVPHFIVPESVHDGDSCIDIIQDEIWEEGDNAGTLHDQITSTMSVTTGFGRNESILDLGWSMKLGGIHIFDEAGNHIGSSGMPLTICAYPNGFYFGRTLLKLEFTSTSGQSYEFYWYANIFRRY